MNKQQLPTDVDELQELVLKLHASNEQLSETVTRQREEIEKQQLKLAEMLQALRGHRRERIDPDQLVLFELGEIETIAKEETDSRTTSAPQKTKTAVDPRQLAA